MTRILVVEDEDHVRKVVKLTLMNEGYEIIEAVHGLMGYTKAVSEQPQLIIMDLTTIANVPMIGKRISRGIRVMRTNTGINARPKTRMSR